MTRNCLSLVAGLPVILFCVFAPAARTATLTRSENASVEVFDEQGPRPLSQTATSLTFPISSAGGVLEVTWTDPPKTLESTAQFNFMVTARVSGPTELFSDMPDRPPRIDAVAVWIYGDGTDIGLFRGGIDAQGNIDPQVSAGYVEVPCPDDAPFGRKCYRIGTAGQLGLPPTTNQVIQGSIPFRGGVSNLVALTVDIDVSGLDIGNHNSFTIFWGYSEPLLSIKPSVAPNTSDAGFKSPEKLIITGNRFVDGIEVAIGEDVRIAPAQVKLISPTQLEVTLPPDAFVGRNEGPRDVTLTFPQAAGGQRQVGRELFFVSSLRAQPVEINQGIICDPPETLNAPPCIADHDTLTRIRLGCRAGNCGNNKANVTGWLHVFKDGLAIPGSPFGPTQQDGTAQTLDLTKTYNDFERHSVKDSLNFLFRPAQNRSLASGGYQFLFEIDPRQPQTLPPRGNAPNRDQMLVLDSSTYPFQRSSRKLKLAVLFDPLMPDFLAEYARGLGAFELTRGAYPTSHDMIEVVPQPLVPGLTFTDAGTVFSQLEKWRSASSNAFDRTVYFFNSMSFDPAGACQRSRIGRLRGTEECTDILINVRRGKNSGAVAHELGHSLGLDDTYVGGPSTGSIGSANPRTANCVEAGCPVDAGFFHFISYAVSEHSNELFTLLDIMGNGSELKSWADRRTWNYLYPKFNGATQQQQKSAIAAAAPSEVILILGTIGPNNQIEWSASRRFLESDAAFPFPETQFTAVLEADGRVLAERRFDPNHMDDPVTQRPFSVILPFQAAAKRIVIKQTDQVLATRDISPNPPRVTLDFPTGGETLADTVVVRWTASDPDGGTLSYTVSYASDGVTSVPLALDLAPAQFTWDTRFHPATSIGRIKVTANDGVNEGSIQSGPLTLAAKGPTIAILSPSNGAQFETDQPIQFEGAGYDPEDGELPGASLTFRSNLDGELGRGRAIFRRLSAGNHTITLEATDRQGNRAVDSIVVSVRTPAPGPDIELFPSQLDFGDVPVGQARVQQFLTYNEGGSTLRLSSVQFDRSPFTLASSGAFTLGPAQQAMISVRFTPTAEGVQAANAIITSDDPDEPRVMLPIVGTGIRLQVSSPRLQLAMAGPDLIFTVEGQVGASYQLERTDALPALSWVPESQITLATPRATITVRRPTAASTFFRLRQQ